MVTHKKSTRARPVRRAARGRSTAGSAPALALGPNLTIAEVAECHRALQVLLAGGAAAIDAHNLKSIDTAGLQLLLVAGRAARERGVTLRLLGGTELLTGAAAALGLREELAASVELSS
ncbi:MAG TPA: STAS domain-containing protein [Steroidobacteraceae bacterium]|nr:STAS domain-containing protein [Steroidobacteraceae bacterium]